jgi:hypothetical protein
MAKQVSIFNDYYKIVRPTDSVIKDFKDSTIDGQKRGLEITLEATHSGIMNRNIKFYIPSRMEDGAFTFVKRQKPAKILKHHDTASDPVGIITDAEYVHTIPEYLMSDKNVQILTDSNFSVSRQISAARSFIKDGYPLNEDFKGLGYIRLKATILDKESIEQILDGRFDAVSTSFRSPGGVYCSECGQNLVKDGFCDHEPGQSYEDEDGSKVLCGLIPSTHNYQECSLVVADADPFTVISIGDSINPKIYTISPDDLKNDSKNNMSEFVYEFKDFKEETIMPKKTLELSDRGKEVLKTVKVLRPDMEDNAAVKVVSEIEALRTQDGTFIDQEDAGIDEATAVQYALESIETKDQEVNADEIYAEIEKELDELNFGDAKLSTESRKKLSGSTFCGPDRSFPVPDCAHVTAARRLIGRYKGPGSKTSILACINRKAKSMGCDKSGDSVVIEPKDSDTTIVKFELPKCNQLSTLSNEDAQSLFAMAESELISRDLKVQRECSKCAEKEKVAQDAIAEKDKAQKETEELADQLKYLRTELRLQMTDYQTLMNEQINLAKKLHDSKVEQLSIVSVLKGGHKDIESAKEELANSDISAQELVIMKDFDLADSAKRLGNGMFKETVAQIADPTIHIDKDIEDITSRLKPAAKKAISNIKEYLADGDLEHAKYYYDKMVVMEILDKEQIPFDSLSADNNSDEDAAE